MLINIKAHGSMSSIATEAHACTNTMNNILTEKQYATFNAFIAPWSFIWTSSYKGKLVNLQSIGIIIKI